LQVSHQNDKPFRPENREQTMAAVALLEKARYQVLEREDKPTSSKPGAPLLRPHCNRRRARVWAMA
jgi:DNA topoisomerase-1